ncbi:MAG: threonine/serine exporter family protein [Austwickia sp.]|nr:MAG: threonine/serine exporter family protein [Austwickia sp.]
MGHREGLLESAYQQWPDQIAPPRTVSKDGEARSDGVPLAASRDDKTKARASASATRRGAKLRARGLSATALRSRLLHAVEGAPPTWGMRLSSVADGVAEARARAVIDLAMRIAEALLTTGSSAADVTATVLQLTDAYELKSVHVDVTYTSITVSHHRGADEDPVTIMRVVSGRATDSTGCSASRRSSGRLPRIPLRSIRPAPGSRRSWNARTPTGVGSSPRPTPAWPPPSQRCSTEPRSRSSSRW